MAWTLVASTSAVGGGSITTSGIDTTGADLLIIVVGSGFNSVTSFTDNKSNTYLLGAKYETGSYLYLYFALKGAGSFTVGAGHTFSAASTPSYGVLGALAFSGSDLSSTTYDVKSSAGTPVSQTTLAPGSITPSLNGELLVSAGYIGSSVDAGHMSVGTPFSTLDIDVPGAGGVNYGPIGAAHYVQPTAGAVNPTWTFPSSTNTGTALIVSFKAATGGGGGSPLFRRPLLNGLGAGGPFFNNPLGRSMLGWVPGLIIPRRRLVTA